MDVRRLSKDEIMYELKVRLIKVFEYSTINQLRGRLSPLLIADIDHAIKPIVSSSFDWDNELLTCKNKIGLLQDLIDSFDGNRYSNHAKHIETKLIHLNGRIARVPSDFLEFSAIAANFRARLLYLEEVAETKSTKWENVKCNEADENESDWQIPTIIKNKMFVSKWDISFSGNLTEMDVDDFLERVEELQVISNITRKDLLLVLPLLLVGKALLWYRLYKKTIPDWDSFKTKLRQEYLPVDYEYELICKIQERKQGSMESISEYFSSILRLYKKLPNPASNEEIMKMIIRNLRPNYIQRLEYDKMNTVEELRARCNYLEKNSALVTKCKMSRNNNLRFMAKNVSLLTTQPLTAFSKSTDV